MPTTLLPVEDRYQPGVCNIGPEEISRRRRFGHLAALVGLAVLLLP